jgi:hypothetical protein
MQQFDQYGVEKLLQVTRQSRNESVAEISRWLLEKITMLHRTDVSGNE